MRGVRRLRRGRRVRRWPARWALPALLGSTYRREALISSISSVVIYACGLASGPVLSRALGPSGRGELAAVIAPVAILGLLLPFGLPLAAAYRLGEVPEGRLLSTATAFGIATGFPLCALLWLLVPVYLRGYSDVAVTWTRLFVASLPLSTGVVAALEVRRRQSAGISWNLWRSAPLVAPTLGVVLLGVIGELTLRTALAMQVVGGLFPLALLVQRLAGGKRWRRPSMSALRMMLPYAWRSVGVAAASSVTARLDQVVLVTTVPASELGLYAVAVTTASVINPVTAGLGLALFGHLRGEVVQSRARARFRRSLGFGLMLSTGVAVVLGLVAPVALKLAFGAPFEDASAALRILLPGAVAFSVFNLLSTKLYAEGRPGEVTRAAALGAGLTILGIGTVVPALGTNGAAVVTSLARGAEMSYLLARGALGGSGPADVASGVPVGGPMGV